MVRDTSSSQDASTHQIWDSYPKYYKRYAPDTIILKTRPEVKVTVTRNWYATLSHPKMHPHTKFGIPTSKNIGDMHWTRSGTDGRTDGRTVRLLYASQSSFGGIKTYVKTGLKTGKLLQNFWGLLAIIYMLNRFIYKFQIYYGEIFH